MLISLLENPCVVINSSECFENIILHIWDPVSLSPTSFLSPTCHSLTHLSAVPAPEARSPDVLLDQAIAFTALLCYLISLIAVSFLRSQMTTLLSLPPEAK